MKLQSRTVLITGGTSGIGLELAKQLHERGNTIIVTGRSQERLEAARRMPPGVHTFKSDVSDPDAIAALHDSVLAQFPTLDTLINNAGIMRNLNLNQTRDLKDVTREIEINLRVQLDGTGVTVIELAPPGVETPLFRVGICEIVLSGKEPVELRVATGPGRPSVERFLRKGDSTPGVS